MQNIQNLLSISWEVPKTIGVASVETLSGITATAFSLLSLGVWKAANQEAKESYSATVILPSLYGGIVNVFDSGFNGRADEWDSDSITNVGLLTRETAEKVLYFAKQSARNQDSWFVRHVVARGAFLLTPIVAAVTRVFDLAIGLIALPFGIVASIFGNFYDVHTFVMEQLTVFALIGDVCSGLRGFENPLQFAPVRSSSNTTYVVEPPAVEM